MAELVEFNLEQSLPFFNGLKEHIDEEKLKEFVRKRRHFEYKICSKNREFTSFDLYLKHELNVLKFLISLQKPEIKVLILNQLNLIERIIKQITIHFQSQPKAFLLAIKVMRRIYRTTSEKSYWTELINKHGSKNVKFYIGACVSAMHDILNIVNKKNKRKTEYQMQTVNNKIHIAKLLHKASKINKLELQQEELKLESEKLKQTNYVDHMEYARKIFLDGFNEYPKHKLLFKEYLKFELLNREYFLNLEDADEDSAPVRDGLLIEYLLNKSLEYFQDVQYFKEILALVAKHASDFQSDGILRIRDLIKSNKDVPVEQMEVEDDEQITKIDHFAEFKRKYPELRMLRVKNPSVVSQELHNYLQTMKEKMISGEIDAYKEMLSLRKNIDWILNDDDWSSCSIDLWWDYYELERDCGDPLKAYMVLQNADQKLKIQFKSILNLRKLKSMK